MEEWGQRKILLGLWLALRLIEGLRTKAPLAWMGLSDVFYNACRSQNLTPLYFLIRAAQ